MSIDFDLFFAQFDVCDRQCLVPGHRQIRTDLPKISLFKFIVITKMSKMSNVRDYFVRNVKGKGTVTKADWISSLRMSITRLKTIVMLSNRRLVVSTIQ